MFFSQLAIVRAGLRNMLLLRVLIFGFLSDFAIQISDFQCYA